MPYQIVVADASPSVQKAVQMAFPESDYKLHFVESGAGFFDGLASVQPDTILISLSLPEADPYEIAKAVAGRDELRKVPLFFLRGTFELFDSEKANGLAYDAVIQKPFDSEKLAATIREAIERKITPSSMPEEPLWEDMLPGKAGVPRPALSAAGTPPTSEEAFRAKVQELVKREVLDMERELEKRIRARILAELKDRS